MILRLSFVETVTRPPAERGLYVLCARARARALLCVCVCVCVCERVSDSSFDENYPSSSKTAELLSSITEVLYKLMPVTRDGDLLVENAADVSLAASVYTTVHTSIPSTRLLSPSSHLDGNNTLVFP